MGLVLSKGLSLGTIGGGGGGGEVTSVNGKKGNVVLDANDVNAVPQYETMPTASASNVGELAQYSGETIPDVPATAVATQTVGSGLSDLSVNVETFIEVEQPSGAETVAFTANAIPSDMTFTSVPEGVTITVTNADSFVNWIRSTAHDPNDYTNALLHDNGAGFWSVALDSSMSGIITGMDAADWANYGIVITGSPIDNYDAYYELTIGQTTWSKNGTTVDVADYGISYTGTPADGDTISVAYTPFVAGITNGYFYKSSVEYTDPTATISQTVGSGLSDLVVNVDTFIEAEQPTQDETVSFVADVTPDAMNFSTQSGDITFSSSDASAFKSYVMEWTGGAWYSNYNNAAFIYSGDNTWSWGPQEGGVFRAFTTDELTAHGISIVGTPANGDTVFYSYIAGETSWTKNGTTVDLANYGISYSGTPVDGDTLTVAYTAPAPIGYYWKQTDVQPSSGGGNAGIEWKTKVDLPAEYTGDQYSAKPYYTISGGLPDGTYEFYFSTKVTTEGSGPLGEVAFKILVTIDNTNAVFDGKMGYVFDGNYMNDGNTVFGGDTKEMYSLVFKHNNDTILFCSEYPWASDVFGYITPRLVPECFKLSAIKNVDTGNEYVATGAINLDGSWPEYTSQYDGSVELARLVNPPYIPQATTWTTLSAAGFETKTVYISKRIMGGSLHLITDGSELIINIGGVGENEISPYSQEIVRATGIFADCYLTHDSNYVYVMGVDTVTAATLSDIVRCACGGSSNDSISIWFDTIPTGSTTPLAQFGPQAYRLGTITHDNLGNIVQYTGETNANYTNGYFYKAAGTPVTIPASLVFTNVSPSDFTVTVADPDALITAMNNYGGWGEQWVKDRLAYEYSQFSIAYDADTGTVSRVWWSNFGDFYAQDVFDCFAVNTTGSYSGEVSVSFDCNSGYTPESKDVQNPQWEQVDVQPSGGGNVIDDSTTALDKTWSSSKLNTMIGNVETLINAL